MDLKIKEEVQKTTRQDKEETKNIQMLISKPQKHETEFSFVKQIIKKEEVNDEMVLPFKTENDCYGTSDEINEQKNIDDCGTEIEKVYIKEDNEIVQNLKTEHESDESFHIQNESQFSEDIQLIVDNERNIAELSIVDSSVIKASASDNDNYDDNLNGRNSKTVKTMPRDKGTFMCVECNKVFSYLITLQRHYKNIHKRVVYYNCHICNQRFPHIKELNIHIRAVHIEKEYKCYECNKCFTQSAGLEKHIIAIHKRIKSFKCEQCTESFSQSSSLNRHVRAVHEGIKNHECQQCHKKFSNSSGLKSHIAVIHEGAKNFECEYCHKKFCYFSKLEKHMSVTHKRFKHFQCGDCKKWYSELGVLKRHIRIVHEQFRKFGCDECGTKFGQLSTLKIHIKNVHVYKQNMQV